jgi:hypothetical protein
MLLFIKFPFLERPAEQKKTEKRNRYEELEEISSQSKEE